MNFHFSKMGIRIVIIFVIAKSCLHYAQIIAHSSSLQFYLFPEINLYPYTNSSSANYPKDTIELTVATPNHLYTLSTDGVVQVYDKNNPSLLLANITDYFQPFDASTQFQVQSIAFDEQYQTMLLSSFYNATLRYILCQILNNSLPQSCHSIDLTTSFVYAPLKTFIANSKACSFFSAAAQNDSIFCLDLIGNQTSEIILPTVNSSIAISPNGRLALVWTKNTVISIYNLTNNFSLIQVYNGSFTNQAGTTNFIRFSLDSAFALIQTDNHNPIVILNLTSDASNLSNITIHKKIQSVDFLDVGNRFILINCAAFTYVYDTATQALLTFNASLNATSLLVDQNTSQIIALVNGTYAFWGANITINGTIVYWHYFASSIGTTTTKKSNGISNFTYHLNLTEWQNQTYDVIQSGSSVINDMMSQFNSVVFSSPLACFFLGFFNYFVLNSLYILLNLPLPDIVFIELSSMFESTTASLLSSIGVEVNMLPFTDELVDDDRALYFGISSDLISSDYYPFALFAVNAIIIEILLAIRHKIPHRFIIYHFLEMRRQRVYFGLIVSMIVGNILPWKFIIFGQTFNYNTRMNSAIYNAIFASIIYFLATSLISTFDEFHQESKATIDAAKKFQTPKDQQTNQKIQFQLSKLPQWMIGFQNFLYPLLVLLSSPMYFLVAILVSKIIEMVIFMQHSKKIFLNKLLQMCSFICEIIFHMTFFVFAYVTDQTIIGYNSIICLGFLFLGAIINFIIVIVFLISVATRLCKASKKANRIAQMNELKVKKKKMKSAFSKSPTSPITICEENESNEFRVDISKLQDHLRTEKLSKSNKKVRFQTKQNKTKNIQFDFNSQSPLRYNYFDLDPQPNTSSQ